MQAVRGSTIEEQGKGFSWENTEQDNAGSEGYERSIGFPQVIPAEIP